MPYTPEVLDAEECLEHGVESECRGPVEMHTTDGRRSWPRCTKHAADRLARFENSIERYADSDVEPSWFDPSYAGESWNDD